MPIRKAEAIWEGSLREGKGIMKLASGAFEGHYTYASRFEEAPGTNPEELIGASLAGCFSMALSSGLGKMGFTPNSIHTRAEVHLGKVDGKSRITQVHLMTAADVPDISQEQFQKAAEDAKNGCPVSNALTGVQITLEAKLL
jgi:osmotically inducible protein OsmC